MCIWKLLHFHGPLFPTWKLSNFQGVEIFIFPCLLRRCLRLLLATDWYSPQTGNDKIFIIFITWKLPNFQFREIFIFPWLAISNMEIIQFPRCACGNCHISMALYFQHGNYQISNAWKFSYFHGENSAFMWLYSNAAIYRINTVFRVSNNIRIVSLFRVKRSCCTAMYS